MASPVFRYPLDPTGVNPDNHVVREPQTLTPKADLSMVRVFAPLYGPFFAESMVILDAASAKPLVRTLDYRVTDLLQDPTLEFGKEIGQFVVVTNGLVSNDLEVSYQVLGGNYQNDATAVQHVYETFLNDTRPVDWSNVGNKPATYPPSLHIHLLQDIINFGPLVVAIDELRDAKLLNNTPMFEALIQWVKTKSYNWSDIQQKPTTVADFGITDAVTTSGAQEITGAKTFWNVEFKNVVNAISTTTGKPSPIATIDDVSYTGGQSIPNTRKILTPDDQGLTGGGVLSTDLSLGLADTTVVPGTYGTSTKTAVVSIDRHGRITEASDIDLSIQYASLVGLPDTIKGYGITDAVDLTSDQVISGIKTINTALLGINSKAVNYHNSSYSSIITKDYLDYINPLTSVGDQRVLGTKTFDKAILSSSSTAGNYHNTGYSSIVTKDYLTYLGYVDLIGEQIITGKKTFESVVLISAVAKSVDDGSISPVATVSQLGKSTGESVPKTRIIDTPDASGLNGGGALQTDLSLSLRVTGVESGVYGSETMIPCITVDDFGRVMYAQQKSPFIRFSDLREKPTTVAGYGITDAVDITSTQTITGKKTFNDIIVGPNASAMDATGKLSNLVSEALLSNLLSGYLTEGVTAQGIGYAKLGDIAIMYGLTKRPADGVLRPLGTILTLPYTIYGPYLYVGGLSGTWEVASSQEGTEYRSCTLMPYTTGHIRDPLAPPFGGIPIISELRFQTAGIQWGSQPPVIYPSSFISSATWFLIGYAKRPDLT